MGKHIKKFFENLKREIFVEKCKSVDSAYRIFGILIVLHAIVIFAFGFAVGLKGAEYPGSYTLYFTSNPLILKIATIIETIYAILYLIPIGIGFVHDLLYESKPKYLITMFIMEICIFMLLRFIEVFANNVVLLIVGLILLVCFGSFSFIVIDTFGLIVAGGVGIWSAAISIGVPVVVIIFIIQCIAEMFV